MTQTVPADAVSTPSSSAVPLPNPDPFRSITDGISQLWSPILTLPFTGTSSGFVGALDNMIAHPEYSSTWIMRSETLFSSSSLFSTDSAALEPRAVSIPHFTTTHSLVRQILPRNPLRDQPAIQTVIQLSSTDDTFRELFLLLPHTDNLDSLPYYLPKVAGIGFLFTPSNAAPNGGSCSSEPAEHTISLYYVLPSSISASTLPTRLQRTALHLLERAVKLARNHGTYEKRVYHDCIIPREVYQDAYIQMRERHAKRLLKSWVEKTDPTKHIFEDIGIASLLCCIWGEMYHKPGEAGEAEDGVKKKEWKGFVDIGCGNGVLVDILTREGWTGWGFDARARRSWEGFEEATRGRLKEGILVPWILEGAEGLGEEDGVFDGRFEEGTFIIANHADELTAWAPLLAKQCNGAFMAIPCCSHDLGGQRKRFAVKKDNDGEEEDGERSGDLKKVNAQGQAKSTYAGLVGYVERLARDLGWVVEKDTLRIPSTRNVAVMGRVLGEEGMEIQEVLEREGGGRGWVEAAEKLRKGEVKGH